MSVIAYVQNAQDFTFTSGASVIVPYGSNVTSGNLMLACAMSASGDFVIADNLNGGQTWTQFEAVLSGGYGVIKAWWAVANATGACTVTLTKQGGGSMSFPILQLLEFSGNTASPFDHHASNGSANSVAVVASQTNEMAIGFAIPQSGDSFGPSAGWTQKAANYGGVYQIETTAGTYSPSVSPGFGTCGIVAATFLSTSSVAQSGNRISTFWF